MKVILEQDVRGQGKRGQLIDVSDGYARNFLLPRKLAKEATADNINTMRMNDKALQEKQARERAEAVDISNRMRTLKVIVTAKGGGAGRLFGSVTTKEISEALMAQYQIDLPKARLELAEPIKSFGTFQAKAKLYTAISGTVTVQVLEEQ